MNKKRVHRLYREEGLTAWFQRRRKRTSHLRVVTPRLTQRNEQGSMDFVADTWLNGRWFRTRTAWIITLSTVL